MKIIKDTVGFFLLLTPVVSILAAGLYFQILSKRIKFVPAEVFGLQDYFNKAVDLLFPVFVINLLSLALGFILVFPLTDRLNKRQRLSAEPESGTSLEALQEEVKTLKKHLARWRIINTLICTLIAILMIGSFFVLTPEYRTVSYGFGLFLSLILFGNFSENSRIISSIKNKLTISIHPMAAFYILALFGFVVLSTIAAVDTSLKKAKSAHFPTKSTALIDNFELGRFVLEDGHYKIKSTDGSTIIESNAIETKSASIACKNNWKRLCWGTIDYSENKPNSNEQEETK